MLSLVLAAAMAATVTDGPPAPGVSEALARERAAAIHDLRYDLAFDIPGERDRAVSGRARISLRLKGRHRIVLDFSRPRERVRKVAVGGRPTAAVFSDDHIIIPAEATSPGTVTIDIEFVAGDEALNRNDEFLYTLFVPARAHLAFPCFDQPDLKGRYTLSLALPEGWQAVANGREQTMTPGRDRQFVETPPLPTYLFAFAAGKFSLESATRDGRTFRMYHRETDATKVARNREAVFDLHAKALAWLERYTGIPYPFGKFDIVLIPSFQFGGMEHPGAIFYNASGLLLDESATQNQLLERASVIAHETAHMWFGDLVTMQWFNDVWMKEVFANFMAGKIVNPSFPGVNHTLRFLLSHYPAAYQVDRTPGTNAIRQPLANLAEAGQLYGAIIYQKAPVMMRQLEMIVGETKFQEGLRQYLQRYAFGNATWRDLIRILDGKTRENLAAWSRVWVEERGRPTVTARVDTDTTGRLSALIVSVSDPMDRGRLWPQRLQITLGYPGETKDVPAFITRGRTTIRDVRGSQKPLFVLPNGQGLGYGLFLLDAESRAYLVEHVADVADALTRGSAWVTLWDNMLEGAVTPQAFLDAAMRALPRETDEQNVQRVLGYLNRAFWKHLDADARAARQATLETLLRNGLERASTVSQKAAWFNAYRDTARSADAIAWLTRVWRREERIPGLPLAEPDEITLALELAVREAPEWPAILQGQLERTQNPDRKARFEFVMPALAADPAVRERAFERFRNVQNRRREPWVLESLQYLHHPLRAAHATRFIQPSLDLLREIQQTGDIFFPTRWMEATLSGHRTPEVAGMVRQFLAQHPDYPERLRWTILTAADELFRAAQGGAATPAD